MSERAFRKTYVYSTEADTTVEIPNVFTAFGGGKGLTRLLPSTSLLLIIGLIYTVFFIARLECNGGLKGRSKSCDGFPNQ